MAVTSPRELKSVLFREYDGFGDKRIKNLDRDEVFIVDDRGPGDYDARKQLFLWFCLIFARVKTADLVEVTIRGGFPTNDSVAEQLKKMGATESNIGTEFNLTPENLTALDELARRVDHITRKPYPVAAFKYVAPRTAASIRRLSSVLVKAWSP